MRLPIFSFLLFVILAGCTTEYKSGFDVADVPEITPEKITQFDSAGGSYFSLLSHETVVLNNESILLPDMQENKIYKIDTSGELIDIAVSEGRGPGEVQNILSFRKSPAGGAILYDQRNKKVVILDEEGNYKHEYILPAWEGGSLTEVYSLNRRFILITYRSLEHFINPDQDPEAFLVLFDKDRENYTDSRTVSSRPYARNFINGEPRGGRRVPFSAEDIRAFDPETGHFYLFRSNENTIAQIDQSLSDTLRTISINFQPERISSDEKREIREDLNSDSWNEMEKLLPDYKALADDMLIDHQQNFWLKLNHASEHQQWLIVSQEGDLLRRVNLPKDTWLTHVSEHHLGVRLDAVTFALYEPVNL